MNDPKISSGSELDWTMVERAAQDIVKQATDAWFVPPEAVDVHLMRVQRVCAAMNAIVDALKLRRNG